MNGMSYLEFRLSTVYMFFQNNLVPIPTCLELPTRVMVLVQTRPTTCSFYYMRGAQLALGKVMDHSHFTTVTVKDQLHFTTTSKVNGSSVTLYSTNVKNKFDLALAMIRIIHSLSQQWVNQSHIALTMMKDQSYFNTVKVMD